MSGESAKVTWCSENKLLSLKSVPAAISAFNTDYSYSSLCCLDSGLSWIHIQPRKLQLTSRNGSPEESVDLDFDISDITLANDGENIFLADVTNNCIKSMSGDRKIKTLFTPQWRPTGLCCLQNNGLLISFYEDCKLVRFSDTGEIRHNLEHEKVMHPLKVATNKFNQDIYVVDCESLLYYYGKVAVFTGESHFRYDDKGQGDGAFCPVEVCTDVLGHVLITDLSKSRVHILDQAGHFLRHIYTSEPGLRLPKTIDVDREGYVWVGEYIPGGNMCVGVWKYLE